MTHDEMIAVIAAHRDGKAIELRATKFCGDWSPADPIIALSDWDFFTYDYRIKPEPPKPRECWVKFDSHGSVLHAHKDGHDESPDSECGRGECGYVLMREVMP